ncbi:hypothetical protein D9M68_765030 [compost metagenome]
MVYTVQQFSVALANGDANFQLDLRVVRLGYPDFWIAGVFDGIKHDRPITNGGINARKRNVANHIGHAVVHFYGLDTCLNLEGFRQHRAGL